MPNLPAHVGLAYRAAEHVGHPTLDSHMGHFLLGSTSPDVRIITRGQREEHHFAPLTFSDVGAGVKGLFEAHPHLLPGSNTDGPTQAFVAGYVTHLVLDEVWVVDMYRRHFGNPNVFDDGVYGKVMDRALQLELDRLSQERVEAALPLLAEATDGVEVGFISTDTLAAWRRWVIEFVGREFSWERLRFMARRVAAGDEAHPAHRVADEFLRTMPASLERLYRYVGPNDLADFQERSTESLSRAVGEYLS